MREGLTRSMLVPKGTAWADFYVGASRNDGAFLHGEVVTHPWERVGVYGFGQVSMREAMAGLGVRFNLW